MRPLQDAYKAKVEQCKERIREGQSYELCLTDQTIIKRHTLGSDTVEQGRQLYRKLRQQNPAPFAAMLCLPCGHETVQILSSSPERFLNWTRTGHCQFRPIKGTVKKSPSMTRAKAEAILKSEKEQAENLMIVDLIRHDLHGVLDYENVKVSKLMAIEEYKTVYQLVSVIEGHLPANGSKAGIEVLAASLPPGSMTGAPKKRSCELLQEIEDKPRGVYSGVLGYLDVGGGGDFSVVIRTGVNWSATQSDRQSEDDHEWNIGAGGAVTIQSTAEGEFQEMEVKRDALFSVFSHADQVNG
jgi:para-aminobenzoate synthetase